MNETSQYGGPQMVRIDGEKVRRLREQRGLTQLYVATVVEVTTDTISRWENRRYPSIKMENAEKLAEALQVGVEDFLDLQETAEPAEKTLPEQEIPYQPPTVKTSALSRPLLFLLLFVAVLITAYLFSKNSTPVDPAPFIRAERVVPPHVPAGQSFPVIIKVTSTSSQPVSVVLRDTVPSGCKAISGQPPISSTGKDQSLVKWVTRLEGSKTFAYLVKSPPGATGDTEMVFSGQILSGPGSGRTIELSGNNTLRIRNFHWADTNLDLRIDDEEILAVYDLFSEITGFEFKGEQLDELWAADRYSYDTNNHRYEVSQ
ncbi:MAG: helix-turn-helix domain-containing protein [Proteobacteria bacterium]|nr:helix-turn-helix domain-containing protein [Pseudomonadota bacterium]MBU1739677.1 helix-turn-helix domain-containing protein [Pseudomonadota bacterium]